MSAKCCVTAGPMGISCTVQPSSAISARAFFSVRLPVPKPGIVIAYTFSAG